jgi:hypothetical protein
MGRLERLHVGIHFTQVATIGWRRNRWSPASGICAGALRRSTGAARRFGVRRTFIAGLISLAMPPAHAAGALLRGSVRRQPQDLGAT